MRSKRKEIQEPDCDKEIAPANCETPGCSAKLLQSWDLNPANNSWELQMWWPQLFILYKKAQFGREPIYRVEMDSALQAKFSALSRGTTDDQAGSLYQALWKSHLLGLHEKEFCGLFSFLQAPGPSPDTPANFSQMDPIHQPQLEDIVEMARLLNEALFPELDSLVYQDENAEDALRALELRFGEALRTFSRVIGKAYTKKSNRLYTYKGATVSLPWLAIRCAYDFVIAHRKLPNQMQLKVNVEKASKKWKQISRATWSDALKTAGLSMLPQAKKHTSKKYRDEVRNE